MSDLFYCNDYREALKTAIDQRRLRGEKLSAQSLAEHIGIQAPYLSKVFNGQADLNQDQLFLLCERLEITGEEAQYIELLLELTRCSIKRRKENLKQQIKSLQNEKVSPTRQRDKMAVKDYSENLAQYYLDPITQQVHMLMTIPKWRTNHTQITERLGIDSERLSKILKVLEDLEVIEIKNKSYVLLKDQMHLPKTHPLCRPQQNLLRFSAAQRLQKQDKDNFNFMATFAADEKTKNQIQHHFMAFLKTVEGLVEKAPSEDIYHLQFDLFNW